ncbi:MAG TPA: hypothetical protein VNR00_09840 [Opitutus sp.]|nr:hypothetical protein [Opitutus sp.]
MPSPRFALPAFVAAFAGLPAAPNPRVRALAWGDTGRPNLLNAARRGAVIAPVNRA